MKKFKYILMLMVLIFVSSCNEKEILKEEPKDFFAVDNGIHHPAKHCLCVNILLF